MSAERAGDTNAERARSASPDLVEKFWQPIETAPKDGTLFLAADRLGNRLVYRWQCAGDFTIDGWRMVGLHGWFVTNLTHWMPLPDPPTEAK